MTRKDFPEIHYLKHVKDIAHFVVEAGFESGNYKKRLSERFEQWKRREKITPKINAFDLFKFLADQYIGKVGSPTFAETLYQDTPFLEWLTAEYPQMRRTVCGFIKPPYAAEKSGGGFSTSWTMRLGKTPLLRDMADGLTAEPKYAVEAWTKCSDQVSAVESEVQSVVDSLEAEQRALKARIEELEADNKELRDVAEDKRRVGRHYGKQGGRGNTK